MGANLGKGQAVLYENENLGYPAAIIGVENVGYLGPVPEPLTGKVSSLTLGPKTVGIFTVVGGQRFKIFNYGTAPKNVTQLGFNNDNVIKVHLEAVLN